MARRGGKAAALAVVAGAASVALFAVYIFWWWNFPDLMWQLAIGLALIAVAAGFGSTRRVGLLGAFLGALALAYFALLFFTLGSD